MKAQLLSKIGKMEYTQMPDPVAGEDEVIVAVKAAGVCGSDIARAFKDGAHKMPIIIGHEFAGEVADTGRRVGVFPLIPCRKCPSCLKKQYEMCANYNYLGSRCNGGFAQYVAVPKWNLIDLPDNVSFEEAAMLEPMAVAVHAMRRAYVKESDTVVVCGLGTIGLLLTMFLIEKGVKNLLVIGNKEFQKKTALELGIAEENYCNSKEGSVSDFIKDRTNGAGADVFYECVGNNTTVSLAIENAARGGKVCFVGNPHSDMTLDKPVYWGILRKQLTITGTWNSSYLGEDGNEDQDECPYEADDWKYCISKLAEGKINPAKLITHKFPLETIVTGMEIMRDKSEDYIKVMAIMD